MNREQVGMASDATDPSNVADATDDATAFCFRDSRTTDLTAAEGQSLARSRKVAFCVLTACAVLAIGGAVYFWYLWFLTAKTCIDTYIVKSAESIIIHPGLATSWQDYLVGLDISSFSALTLALLFTRLAYLGSRNTIWYFRRDGWAYFGRAYHSVLFTEGFETLCVRFGLLGTLLSFLLAAVAQMSSESAAEYRAPDNNGTSVTKVIAQEPGGSKNVLGDLAAEAKDVSTTDQLSSEIFLLLCASLVSTFVGTGVAYMVTPSFNWINERALGLHQLGQADATFAAEEFFRQVTRTSQRLAQFETTTVRLAQAADSISHFDVNVATTAKRLGDLIASFEGRVGTTAKKLTELIGGLERTVQTLDVSTHTSKQLAKKLDQLEAMSGGMSAMLDRLPERLNDPLKNMSLTAGKFREAALSGEAAFRTLKDVAGTAGESLKETTLRANTTWQMLREVQDSLKELAKNEETQTTEVSKLVEAFDTIGVSLGAVVRELGSLGPHLRQRDGGDHEASRLLAAQRSQLLETLDGSTGNDKHGMTTRSRARSVDDLDEPRSWWQRLFR
jgi:methyl-accepting chemotaxis protein